MKRLRHVTVGRVVALVALGAVTFTMGDPGGRSGTDELARQSVHAAAPTYRPWAHTLRTNSPQQERLLFALQGVIGAVALGWAVSRLRRTEGDRASQ